MLKRTIKQAAAAAAVATVGVVGFGTAAGAHAPDTHVVQPGDTLFKIAGSNWAAVAQANGIANPDLIFPGDVIRLDVSAS
ncbi:MAG: LysM peptidoglycan-binding domain-containing protein, partial [Acidimicrobiales bacterium]|nr:LysM peptidoglycan-binding domain-containing protein [Acidimicrobiales bacterium]